MQINRSRQATVRSRPRHRLLAPFLLGPPCYRLGHGISVWEDHRRWPRWRAGELRGRSRPCTPHDWASFFLIWRTHSRSARDRGPGYLRTAASRGERDASRRAPGSFAGVAYWSWRIFPFPFFRRFPHSGGRGLCRGAVSFLQRARGRWQTVAPDPGTGALLRLSGGVLLCSFPPPLLSRLHFRAQCLSSGEFLLFPFVWPFEGTN